MWRAVLAECGHVPATQEQVVHLFDVIGKGRHHGLVLLGQLSCDGVTLKQALEAFQQLEGGGQCGAVIKRLQEH